MEKNKTVLKEINCHELKDLEKNTKVLIIDVREPSEHQEERLPGSVLIPLSQFDCQRVKDLLKPDQKLVLHCRSGKRSEQAAHKLLESGFLEVVHLSGGIIAWKQAGFVIEKKVDAPISLFRQIQIVSGSLVVIGTSLGVFIDPAFLWLSGFVGAGLLIAGITNTCALGALLLRLPYNKTRKSES